VTVSQYMTSSRFWFESFQNWQSEFLSLWAMVVFTIYLRQKGSPESKPVAASHDENEDEKGEEEIPAAEPATMIAAFLSTVSPDGWCELEVRIIFIRASVEGSRASQKETYRTGCLNTNCLPPLSARRKRLFPIPGEPAFRPTAKARTHYPGPGLPCLRQLSC